MGEDVGVRRRGGEQKGSKGGVGEESAGGGAGPLQASAGRKSARRAQKSRTATGKSHLNLAPVCSTENVDSERYRFRAKNA